MIDPDETRDRWLALQDPAAVAQLRTRCEAAAVQERDVAFSWWAYHPRPFPRAMAGERPGRRGCLDARLAVDAGGRPVMQRLRDEIVLLYAWDGDRCEILSVQGTAKELVHLALHEGRLVEEVSTEGMRRLDGRPAVHAMRWSYDDAARPSLALETYESGEHRSWGGPERGPYWTARAYTFSYDDAGELATILCHVGADAIADGHDHEAAQAAAAAGFPERFEAFTTLFDARTQRVEDDLPDPEHAYEGLAEPLADAIFDAVARRRVELGPLEFVLVASSHAVSRAIAADASFVDRAGAMGHGVRELLDVASREPRGTVIVDAIDTAPADVLRRLRAGAQALAAADGPRTAATELERALTVALNAREWPGVAPTFVVLTAPPSEAGHWDRRIGREDEGWHEPPEMPDAEIMAEVQQRLARLDPGLSGEQLERAFSDLYRSVVVDWAAGRVAGAPPPAPPSPLAHLEDVVDRHRLEAFVARVGNRDVAWERELATERDELRPQSRAELAQLLEGIGLTPDEAAALAADALWGILLEPGGSGVSRLGGAPVLPAGTPWPAADGRALTHLATIALDELPAVEGREHLPSGGLLSFFADLSEEGELYEPIEPGDDWGRDRVAVVHTPAGAATHEPSPPGAALVERRVRPAPRLQLRHLGFDYGHQRFGIDALAEDAVVDLTERVNGTTQHQLLGHPWPVQDDPREPGQIVLFHTGDDPEIDLHILDGGDLHFLGSPQDIAAQRWDQLTVWPNSC